MKGVRGNKGDFLVHRDTCYNLESIIYSCAVMCVSSEALTSRPHFFSASSIYYACRKTNSYKSKP